ncbi:MAG: hypothetical protein ACFNL2_11060, partial [Tannerella forsythia]
MKKLKKLNEYPYICPEIIIFAKKMGKSIKIEIDVRSGFCHGVIRAIRKAEQELNTDKSLYCLGEIVHN